MTWNDSTAVVSHLYDGENDVFFEVIPDLAIDNFEKLPDGTPNPNYGNLYVTWTRAYAPGQFPGEPDASGGTDLFIALSKDSGESWITRTREQDGATATVFDYAIDNTGRNIPPGVGYQDQARVSVGRQGEVYVSAFDGAAFPVHVSFDAGVTFAGPDTVTQERFVWTIGEFAGVSSDGLPGNHFRTHAQRGIAADPIREGFVYAVEPISSSASDGNVVDPADVILRRSTDFGRTWQSILKVGPYPNQSTGSGTTGVPLNDDNFSVRATVPGPEQVTSGQAIPRIAVGDDGMIGVVWYDTRSDPANELLDVFASISTDGGETFSPNFRLTDVSFDADQGVFVNAAGGEEYYLGDFIGLSIASGKGVAAWTDTRTGNQDIFFSTFDLNPPPAPPNDRFEPNDTPEVDNTSTMLGRVVQRTLPKLSAAPGDNDYFLFETAATGELVATARFTGDLPSETDSLVLELYDSSGVNLLATAGDLYDTEGNLVGKQIRFLSESGDTFQVRVAGIGSEAIGYMLQLQSLTADLGVRAFTSQMASVSAGGGALYRVVTPASGSIDVQLTGGDNVTGDLTVQVLDAETLQVLGVGQAPPSVPISAISSEPNDSLGQANETGLTGLGSVSVPSTIGDGAFGATSGDLDYFRFDAGANTLITVDLNVTSLESSLDSLIALYDSSGQALQVVDNVGPGSDESLTFTTVQADTYSVAIMGWESFPPDDPGTPGTGAGAGGTGEFVVTIATEASGPGAVKRLNLPALSDDAFLVLVTGGADSSGDFQLDITNLDQFETPNAETLLFPAGAGPSSLDLGDVNLDGNVDVVVANALADTVSVLLGTGQGTLLSPRQFKIGAFVMPNPILPPTFLGRDVEISEFNGDGLPDIIVTNFDSSDVSVLLGRGDGTFEPQRRFDATTYPNALDVGDLDNDGNTDVVVVETTDDLPLIDIVTLMGRGDGTFRTLTAFQADSGTFVPPRNPTLADLNQDGVLDLLLAGDIDPRIEVQLGNGDGTFSLLGRFESVDQAPDLAVDDINGDSLPDVIAVGYDSFDVSVLFGNGDGTLQDQVLLPLVGQGLMDAEVMDFGSEVTNSDGTTTLGPRDGKSDIVVVASGLTTFVSSIGGPEIIVVPTIFDDQDQFVGFGKPHTIVRAEFPLDADIGDLNNDGVDDIAVADRSGALLIFGDAPNLPSNTTLATARDLGTVVHFLDQTQTIVPERADAYYKFTVPTEVVTDADQVVDLSLLFEAIEGPGIDAELLDGQGNVLGRGERFRVRAHQGEELVLHVFGVDDGTLGYGAFTPIINVLPQVVSVESQALLPGASSNPGGPTTAIVLTFQGDRLDPATAEDISHYTVTAFGPDRLLGTADDQILTVSEAVYSPSTNVEISSGRTFPTAIRQTVALLFDEALPAGSYHIETTGLQSEPYNQEELELLAELPNLGRHPLMAFDGGYLTDQVSVAAIDLVLAAGELGDLGVFTDGTRFLSQLHNDLSATLDEALTELGDDASVSDTLLDQILGRLAPALGERGDRPVSLFALFLDPVSLNVSDLDEEEIAYDLAQHDDDPLVVTDDDCYVEVGGNIEVIVCTVYDPLEEFFDLRVDDVPETVRGGYVLIGPSTETVTNLTPDLRSGTTNFRISFP